MPNLTESEVYAAFGLKQPEDAGTGANGQEPAQPVETNPEPETGAKEQEPAQPAQEPEDPAIPAGEDSDGEDSGGTEEEEPDKAPMDEKTRRENAARRRKQEQKQAIDAAVQEALRLEREKTNAEWNRFFAASGLKDPETGKPITTKEEYESWQKSFQTRQLKEKLKNGELTEEMLQQIIDQNPVVQQARQLLDQRERDQQQVRQQEEESRIQSEIEEIGKLDPGIRSVEDLLNMPEEKYTEFKGYVDKGYSFVDAYRLSHMDQIADRRAEQARQAAMDNERGKGHLRSSKGQGTGPVSVPADVMKSYRLFNPKATDAEIRDHYNKQLKK